MISTDAEAVERWWRAKEFRHHVYGVFQGGGARGVAYVGALQEFKRRHCWFEAVAGASAGAIVATFVAAGFRPDRLLQLVPDATGSVKPLGRRGWLPSGDPETLGHYDTGHLRRFIEEQLRAQIGVPLDRAHDVTFRELYEATDIELDIVVLAAPHTPVVLNRWSAPDCQVAYAAVASSAIPVVMTPQVLPSGPFASDFVIDGGAWANYPTFVFKDPSVRSFYGAPPVAASAKVLGFVLRDMEEIESASPAAAGRWRPLVKAGSFALLLFVLLVFHALLGRFARMVQEGALGPEPLLLILAVVGIPVVAWFGRPLLAPGAVVAKRALVRLYTFPPFRWMSLLSLAALQLVFLSLLTQWALSFRGGMALLFLSGILLCYATLTFALLMFRYGDAAVATGVPAIRAALRATTGVPEWAGASSSDLVLVVPVMCGIETTSFDLTPTEVRAAAALSASGVASRLDALVASFDGRRRLPDSQGGAGRDLVFLDTARRDERAAQVSAAETAKHQLWARWGVDPGFVMTVFALLVTMCIMTGIHRSNRLPIGLLATLPFALVSLLVCRLWRAVWPKSSILAKERRYMLGNTVLFVIWLTVVGACLATILGHSVPVVIGAMGVAVWAVVLAAWRWRASAGSGSHTAAL